MSVTLNCANCRKAIKETSNPSEIQKITGEEICEECAQLMKKTYREVEAAASAGIKKISVERDKILVDLEKHWRKAVKGGE